MNVADFRRSGFCDSRTPVAARKRWSELWLGLRLGGQTGSYCCRASFKSGSARASALVRFTAPSAQSRSEGGTAWSGQAEMFIRSAGLHGSGGHQLSCCSARAETSPGQMRSNTQQLSRTNPTPTAPQSHHWRHSVCRVTAHQPQEGHAPGALRSGEAQADPAADVSHSPREVPGADSTQLSPTGDPPQDLEVARRVCSQCETALSAEEVSAAPPRVPEGWWVFAFQLGTRQMCCSQASPYIINSTVHQMLSATTQSRLYKCKNVSRKVSLLSTHQRAPVPPLFPFSKANPGAKAGLCAQQTFCPAWRIPPCPSLTKQFNLGQHKNSGRPDMDS